MVFRIILIEMLLTCTVIVTSCGSPQEASVPSSTGGSLAYAEVSGVKIDPEDYEEFTFYIVSVGDGTKGFNGNDGCNSFVGGLDYNKGRYSVNSFITTFRACPDKQLYSPEHFSSAFRYIVTEGELRIVTENSVHVYKAADTAPN